jgi:hypothetical protein
MKKLTYTLIAFAVFAASALAYTGPESTVRIDVPFAFQAGSSILPAGTYFLTQPVNGFVLIRGAKGGIFVPKTALVESETNGKSTFRFNRAGDTYVLQTGHSQK